MVKNRQIVDQFCIKFRYTYKNIMADNVMMIHGLIFLKAIKQFYSKSILPSTIVILMFHFKCSPSTFYLHRCVLYFT